MSDRQATADTFSVTGKAVLVTGASRGVGLMIARGLVASGARVVLTSRNADACQTAAAELGQVGDCAAVPADVSDTASVAELATTVADRFSGRLDVLVNNAGATWGAELESFPAVGWEKVLRTNVQGVFELTVALLPALRAAAKATPPARVLNVGSVAGLRVPDLENYSYTASKAAVHMLTRHLAARLAREGITVNAIAPGYFESRMTEVLLNDPEQRQTLATRIPLGRIGEPVDVDGAVRFLTSRAGAYVTGVVLPVDGGIAGCS